VTEYNYPYPPTITQVENTVTGRPNFGGIVGLGMRINNGERDFLTVRLDSRFDLLFATIGDFSSVDNRIVRLSVGYKFRQSF
jgi:hypothetical protein